VLPPLHVTKPKAKRHNSAARLLAETRREAERQSQELDIALAARRLLEAALLAADQLLSKRP
jgi:hypothetical protein